MLRRLPVQRIRHMVLVTVSALPSLASAWCQETTLPAPTFLADFEGTAAAKDPDGGPLEPLTAENLESDSRLFGQARSGW